MTTTFYERNYVQGMMGEFVHIRQYANPNSVYWREAADDAEARLLKLIGLDAMRSFCDTLPEQGTQMFFARRYQQEYLRRRPVVEVALGSCAQDTKE